jgi:outer membrane immunogenic protein
LEQVALTLRAALFSVAATLFALPAYAHCGGGPFAGPYVGATVGYAHLRSHQSTDDDGKISDSDGGFAAGVFAGYSLQCGHIVGGIETDFNHVDLGNASYWPGPVWAHSSADWYGTVRGRLGVVVHPGVLLYGTAGLAYADVSHTLSDPSLPFSSTSDGFRTGWTAGAGIELLHFGRWMLRTEVLYTDIGSESRTYTIVGPCGGVCTETVKWDDSFWTARVGLALRFGHEERRPVPLK